MTASIWTNNTPQTAWYLYRGGSQGATICRTDGSTFVYDLKLDLLSANPPTPLDSSESLAYTWSPDMVQALLGVLRRDGLPEQEFSLVSSELLSGRIGRSTLRAALAWMRSRQSFSNGTSTWSAREFSSVELPDDLVLPVVGQRLPVALGGGPSCALAPPGFIVSRPHPSPIPLLGFLALTMGAVLLIARTVRTGNKDGKSN